MYTVQYTFYLNGLLWKAGFEITSIQHGENIISRIAIPHEPFHLQEAALESQHPIFSSHSLLPPQALRPRSHESCENFRKLSNSGTLWHATAPRAAALEPHGAERTSKTRGRRQQRLHHVQMLYASHTAHAGHPDRSDNFLSFFLFQELRLTRSLIHRNTSNQFLFQSANIASKASENEVLASRI